MDRPQERPRGQEPERHKSRQRRRRHIHGEFGRSFKQLCKEPPGKTQRNPPASRPPSLVGGSRGRRGHPPALSSLREVGQLPRGRKRLQRRPPAAATALHARQRLLRVVQSYFALGGTGAEPGVTSPCGLRQLRRNAGSGARRRRCCRLLPGRRAPARPRAPRRLCSPPGLGGRAATRRRAGKGDVAQLPAGFPRFNSERQECGSTVG